MRSLDQILLFAFLAAASPTASPAQVATLPYGAGQVIPLKLTPGYASLIEMSPEEHVETVVLGDSEAWQVTPTKRGNALVIKPEAAANTTDLIVTTSDRQYIFLLNLGETGQTPGPFVIRFDYSDERPPTASSSVLAAHYDFRGRAELYPVSIKDDGVRTTISWAPQTSLPAIFAVDDRGHEALVNGRMVGNDFVVERVAAGFVFRRGNGMATATRRPVPSIR